MSEIEYEQDYRGMGVWRIEMAIADLGINPALFSTAFSPNNEVASIYGNVVNSPQRINPVNHISELLFSKMRDSLEGNKLPQIDNNQDRRKKEIFKRISDDSIITLEKEGVYDANLNFDYQFPTGVFIDTYR